MKEPSEEQVVVRGLARTVAYATDGCGEMPAQVFLETTKGKQAPSQQERAGLFHLFRLMAEKGSISNPEQFKKERGEIFGFKKYQARVAAFRVGNVWYLTHGFKKKKNRWNPSDLERADRIRTECMKRMGSRK